MSEKVNKNLMVPDTKRRSAIQIMGSLIGLVIRLLVCDFPDDIGRTGYRAWTSDRGSRNDGSGGQYVAGIYPGENHYHSDDRNCSASWDPALYGAVL